MIIIRQGTIVEVTMKGEHFQKQFVINDSHVTDALYDVDGKIIDTNVLVYHAPFSFSLNGMPKMISCFRKVDLKIINKDCLISSEFDFESLTNTLKNTKSTSKE